MGKTHFDGLPLRRPPLVFLPSLLLLRWTALLAMSACGYESVGQGEKRRKRTTTKIVVRFRGRTCRAPHSMGTLSRFPSPTPPSSHNMLPTSLWKGEGRLGLGCQLPCSGRTLENGPTSLNGGEGRLSRWLCVVGGEFGWGRRRGWW